MVRALAIYFVCGIFINNSAGIDFMVNSISSVHFGCKRNVAPYNVSIDWRNGLAPNCEKPLLEFLKSMLIKTKMGNAG